MEAEILDGLSKTQLAYLAVGAIGIASALGHIIVRTFFNRLGAIDRKLHDSQRQLARLKQWLAATLGEVPPE